MCNVLCVYCINMTTIQLYFIDFGKKVSYIVYSYLYLHPSKYYELIFFLKNKINMISNIFIIWKTIYEINIPFIIVTT